LLQRTEIAREIGPGLESYSCDAGASRLWALGRLERVCTLTDALAKGDDEAKRAFEAMMTMKKIDVAAIEAARRR
jgi:hypothetical protein